MNEIMIAVLCGLFVALIFGVATYWAVKDELVKDNGIDYVIYSRRVDCFYGLCGNKIQSIEISGEDLGSFDPYDTKGMPKGTVVEYIKYK